MIKSHTGDRHLNLIVLKKKAIQMDTAC